MNPLNPSDQPIDVNFVRKIFSIETFKNQFTIEPNFLTSLRISQHEVLIDMMERQVIEIATYVCCDKIQEDKEIEFKKPKNWFEHFKEQYYSNWLLKYFPVKYTVEKKTISLKHLRVFPQIDLDTKLDYYIHEYIEVK